MRAYVIGLWCASLASAVTSASAAVYTYKASAGPAAAPDANSGSVDVWTITASTGDLANAGSFQGDSGSNGDNVGPGAGSSAWALYANSTHSISAKTNLLALIGSEGPADLASESIRIAFDNGYIDSGSYVSLEFLDSADGIASRLKFTGGESTYKIDDSVSGHDTMVPFSDDGFSVTLTLSNTLGGYTLQIGGGTPLSRTLAGGATAVTSVRLVNNNAGSGASRNLFFDNLVVTTVPEPAAFLFGVGASVLVAIGCRCRK